MPGKSINIEQPSNLAPLEIAAGPESLYPLLDIAEVDRTQDITDLLTTEDQPKLRPDEVVIHVYQREVQLPPKPVTPLEILMKAAKAAIPEEIGFMGPTVASVDILGNWQA